MARPFKPIDWDTVDRLIEAQCNGVEIAAYFNVTPETFYERVMKEYQIAFSSYSCGLSSRGLALLKLSQFQKALKGDTKLLIWLGKQYLNQKEHEDKNQLPANDNALNELIIEVKALTKKDDAIKSETDTEF